MEWRIIEKVYIALVVSPTGIIYETSSTLLNLVISELRAWLLISVAASVKTNYLIKI